MARKLKRSELPVLKQKLILKQNNSCPLCERSFDTIESSNIVIDHCHSHGYVRAALCRNCNGREGEILNRAVRGAVGGNHIDWLQRLVDYWRTHETPQTQYIHPTHKTPAEAEAERKRKRARQARARRAKK